MNRNAWYFCAFLLPAIVHPSYLIFFICFWMYAGNKIVDQIKMRLWLLPLFYAAVSGVVVYASFIFVPAEVSRDTVFGGTMFIMLLLICYGYAYVICFRVLTALFEKLHWITN